ncbi:uncharacterized protein K452DRAFT_126190 [Aplosporella prunicola CBS 121167]|uniref:Uncharacterized protein n=1 Tax=Aplosporella prunicola CBS 121167 TaxID=1176127 RepID=A0A6A6BQ16_9PEZI|nr:uncharacterized protein K452DRAFT_126190 [Aplosporella prunicola CBS 121167]KAF2145838.1 hypothetical protein K452DRAFT_126190 [Aplosporella prunicola CBS 121167]
MSFFGPSLRISTCQMWGCQKRPCSGSNLCNTHRCTGDSGHCDNVVVAGTKFCDMHICCNRTCYSEREYGSYCREHVCMEEYCNIRRCDNERYCSEHL